MATYYSTQRPIDLGTYPKPADNNVLEIKNFDKKTEIKNENIMAYGYIVYDKPLIPAAARTYELVQAQFENDSPEYEEMTNNKKLPISDEEIINAAIKKISAEDDGYWGGQMQKKMLEIIPNDVQLAQGILDPLKNFKTCNNYIEQWAKKWALKNIKVQSGRVNRVSISDDIVYAEVIHYFTEVEEKEVNKPLEKTANDKASISNRPSFETEKPMTKKEKAEAQFACSLF